MKDELNEFNKEINEAGTLEAYIKAYRYGIENSIDASPAGVERSTEERMLKELEKFLPKVKLTSEELDNSCSVLVLAIANVNLKLKTLRNELTADDEDFFGQQEDIIKDKIDTLEAEKYGYKKSIHILLEYTDRR